MKKLTITVLTMIALASCSKEYVEPSSTHAASVGTPPPVVKVYEGEWSLNYNNDTTTFNSVITKTTMFNDSILWNFRYDSNSYRYVLDTNGVDTYEMYYETMNYELMRWKQTNLFDESVNTLYYLKK